MILQSLTDLLEIVCTITSPRFPEMVLKSPCLGQMGLCQSNTQALMTIVKEQTPVLYIDSRQSLTVYTQFAQFGS